jgi:hypothetical protein
MLVNSITTEGAQSWSSVLKIEISHPKSFAVDPAILRVMNAPQRQLTNHYLAGCLRDGSLIVT